MSPPQPPQPPTAAGVRFQDQLTPRASPTATPFSAQTPLSRTDMPIGYPGKPPSFPDLPQAKEFRVHQQGRPMDGLENLQVLRHL